MEAPSKKLNGNKRSRGSENKNENHQSAKKRKQARYKQSLKKQKEWRAENGEKGVLVTCAKNREAECIREMFNLLNEYADKLYPINNEKEQENENSESIADALAKEINAMKEIEKTGTRRFYCLDTNVKGVILIRFVASEIDPVPFITQIFRDIILTRTPKTRNVVRIVPIEKTCKADLDKIVETGTPLITRHFTPSSSKKFSVVYKCRHNDGISRMECINDIVRCVGHGHTVDLKNPEAVISIEIFQKACGISVFPNGEYKETEGFNIRKVCEQFNKVDTIKTTDNNSVSLITKNENACDEK